MPSQGPKNRGAESILTHFGMGRLGKECQRHANHYAAESFQDRTRNFNRTLVYDIWHFVLYTVGPV